MTELNNNHPAAPAAKPVVLKLSTHPSPAPWHWWHWKRKHTRLLATAGRMEEVLRRP